MIGIDDLLLISLISAVAGVATGAINSAVNYNSVKETNQMNAQSVKDTNAANLQIAQENNALQMDLAKNGIQYKMADLQAAGLNPVLAAQGAFGSGGSAVLSTPTMQAQRNQAPMVDFSGVGSAVNALSNMMLTRYIMQEKSDIAARHDATSAANAESRNSVLRDLYKRKGIALGNMSASSVNSARTADPSHYVSDKEWKAMLKELDSIK